MPVDLNQLPSYEDLPVKAGAPQGSAWGLFGEDDQLGCLNLLTPERVLEAARLVRKGAVFPLNLRIDEPKPPMFGRGAPRHTLLEEGGGVARDDYLDSFWPQASSQWDGLRHIRHPRDGFYNGVKDEEISQEEGSKLGIENFARRGIVGRGVLLDIERFLRRQGTPLDPQSSTIVRKDILETCGLAQQVSIQPGDILLVRTGWLRWYLEEATLEQRERMGGDAMAGALVAPGIGPADEMARYLWDLHVAAVAGDNPSLEAWPPTPDTGFLHFRLIPHFGMPIGELWYMEELAADCAQDGVYEFLFTSAPLNVPGGVGSPPNALAIK
ncbi:MAG: cyclase family protein [Chloroflexi bacterium]|nr:cyclase family protein [Chloroflexota bacterium]